MKVPKEAIVKAATRIRSAAWKESHVHMARLQRKYKMTGEERAACWRKLTTKVLQQMLINKDIPTDDLLRLIGPGQ